MTNHPAHDTQPTLYDDDLVDAVLDGHVDPADAPPELVEVVTLLNRARQVSPEPGDGHDALIAAVAAATRRAGERPRERRTVVRRVVWGKVIAITATTALGGGVAAAADHAAARTPLPTPGGVPAPSQPAGRPGSPGAAIATPLRSPTPPSAFASATPAPPGAGTGWWALGGDTEAASTAPSAQRSAGAPAVAHVSVDASDAGPGHGSPSAGGAGTGQAPDASRPPSRIGTQGEQPGNHQPPDGSTAPSGGATGSSAVTIAGPRTASTTRPHVTVDPSSSAAPAHRSAATGADTKTRAARPATAHRGPSDR